VRQPADGLIKRSSLQCDSVERGKAMGGGAFMSKLHTALDFLRARRLSQVLNAAPVALLPVASGAPSGKWCVVRVKTQRLSSPF
jgi:hypothetical protein